MMVRLVLAIALAVLSINDVTGAPKPDNINTELLEKSFAEYLRHDPELVNKLEQLQALVPGLDEGGSRRVKRQEIDESSVDVDMGDVDKQPGFFDRAAKFVVELLQRFLRWINTDGN